MGDNPLLGARVRGEDRDEFKQLAKASGKTDADMFKEILQVWNQHADMGSTEMPDELISLKRTLGRVSDIVRGIWSQAASDRERLEAEKAAIQDQTIADTKHIAEKVDRLEEENEALKAESIAAKEEAEEAKKLADTSEKERLSLLRITEDQGQKIRELEVRLKEMEAKAEEANTLKVRNAELNQRAKNAESDLDQLGKRFKNSEAEQKALQENFDRSQKSLHEAKSWAAVLEERSKQLEERLSDLKEQLSDLKKQRGGGRKNLEPEPKSDDDRNQLAINFSPNDPTRPLKKSSTGQKKISPPPSPKK